MGTRTGRRRPSKRTCPLCQRSRWRNVMDREGDAWVCRNMNECLQHASASKATVAVGAADETRAMPSLQCSRPMDTAEHNLIGDEILDTLEGDPFLIGAGAFEDETGRPVLLVITTS